MCLLLDASVIRPSCSDSQGLLAGCYCKQSPNAYTRMPFEQEFGAFGQLATSPALLFGLAQVRFSSCCRALPLSTGVRRIVIPKVDQVLPDHLTSLRAESSIIDITYTLRPHIRQDYPLNLSILLSGGKESKSDSPSNGE